MGSEFRGEEFLPKFLIYRRKDADMPMIEKIRAPVLQIALSAIVSCLGTYLFTIIGTRTMANAIWLFVIPAIIGILFNDGKPRQVLMAFVLMAVSALSCIAFMVAVWGGY